MSKIATDQNLIRCSWSYADKLYEKYHDKEWGVPVHNDQKHFEFLVLEGAQAGLSWLTILKRRQGYKRVFKNFNTNEVANFTKEDIKIALKDPGIIRNKLKVRSAVNNAKVFQQIQREFGSFDKYIWGFVDNKPVINKHQALQDIPATTKLSDTISQDLKNKGMSFVGSTIIYAHLQATGIVMDHTTGCFRYSELN